MNQRPTPIADAYCDTYAKARTERERRLASLSTGEALIVRIEESPYGGYKVWSMPSDVYIDLLTEGVSVGSLSITAKKFGKIPA